MSNGSTKIKPTARAEEKSGIVGYAVWRCGENPAFQDREVEEEEHGIRRWWEAQRVSSEEAWAWMRFEHRLEARAVIR